MKRAIITVLVVLIVTLSAGPTMATSDRYDETQGHPLRVVAYVLHPVGVALEWLIFRPIHYVVSRPALEPLFGHHPHKEGRVP